MSCLLFFHLSNCSFLVPHFKVTLRKGVMCLRKVQHNQKQPRNLPLQFRFSKEMRSHITNRSPDTSFQICFLSAFDCLFLWAQVATLWIINER